MREPHELAPEERGDFFTDLLRVGEALEQAYSADKINYQILGNLVPHLHAHIQPRFYGDAYPGQPVSGAPEQPVFLTADEYLERIAAIRAALQTRLSRAAQPDWHDLRELDLEERDVCDVTQPTSRVDGWPGEAMRDVTP